VILACSNRTAALTTIQLQLIILGAPSTAAKEHIQLMTPNKCDDPMMNSLHVWKCSLFDTI